MINNQFVSAIARASAAPAARIVSRGAEFVRTLSLESGYIVSADSNHPAEGLLAVLAAEKRLDSDLVGPLRAEAAKRKVPPEYLLVEDQLLPPGDVVGALERMASLQFRAALVAQGAVTPEPAANVARRGIRVHAGALLLEQFRALSLEDVREYLGGGRGILQFRSAEGELQELRLQPAEMRIVRGARLDLAQVQDQRALRLGAALVGLDLATRTP